MMIPSLHPFRNVTLIRTAWNLNSGRVRVRLSMSSCFCFGCVDSSQRGVVQQFGKYQYVAAPGLTLLCWPFQTIAGVSTKVQQLDVKTSTKTKDNVTVIITTAVQYAVDERKVEDFFFKLNEPSRQIAAHVENVVRSQIPKMDLDTAFLAKDDLAIAVKDDLSNSMQPYGLHIYGCLMTDMLPDSSVLKAMNEINAARRQREANVEKAEAEKVLAVKRAEAEAESKHLSGIGTAKMRQAITDGFRSSINSMQETCGMEASEVVHMMLVTQYLDVLKDFAHGGKSSIIVPHGPSAVGDIEAQVPAAPPARIAREKRGARPLSCAIPFRASSVRSTHLVPRESESEPLHRFRDTSGAARSRPPPRAGRRRPAAAGRPPGKPPQLFARRNGRCGPGSCRPASSSRTSSRNKPSPCLRRRRRLPLAAAHRLPVRVIIRASARLSVYLSVGLSACVCRSCRFACHAQRRPPRFIPKNLSVGYLPLS